MSSNENQIIRVTVIGENDIVCGRGGAALRHPGNLAYRKIVNINKTLYATCLKAEKLRISKSIVAAIREINGRFLEREDGKIPTTLEDKNPDGTPVTWCDIGDRRAIEKTSQALREGQPKLLKKLKDSGELSPMNEKHENQGYHIPWGAQPPVDPPPLSQIDVPMQEKQNYSYSGSNPSFVKQDSFQMMIGETFNEPNLGYSDQFPTHHSATSHNPHDSWQADPTPLPFNMHSSITMENGESEELLSALDVETPQQRFSINSFAVDSSQSGKSNSPDRDGKHRRSVTFKRGFRNSVMSVGSHFSGLSNWDTQSLDDAMDIAEREMDLKLLGNEELDFDWEDTYYVNNLGSNAQQGTHDEFQGQREEYRRGSVRVAPLDLPKRQRGSILRRTSRYAKPLQNNFGPAALSESTDPGMLFTSTLDAKPGGVNAGTDVSGLLGERRKSAVAFEIKGDQQRRQSYIRLSNMSMFSEIGRMFKRELGSTMSIQTADINELIGMDDD